MKQYIAINETTRPDDMRPRPVFWVSRPSLVHSSDVIKAVFRMEAKQ